MAFNPIGLASETEQERDENRVLQQFNEFTKETPLPDLSEELAASDQPAGAQNISLKKSVPFKPVKAFKPVRVREASRDSEEDTNMAVDIGVQAVMSIPSGLANMVQTASQLGKAMDDMMPTGLIEWRTDIEKAMGLNVSNTEVVKATEDFKNMLPQPQGMAGEITREIGQFATGMIGGKKLLDIGLKANTLLKAGIAGNMGAFSALDAHRDNVFNMLESVDMSPENKAFLQKWVASSDDDSALQGRVKNVIENAFTGVVVQKVFDGLGWLKAGHVARSKVKNAEKIKPMYEEVVVRLMDEGYTDVATAQAKAIDILKIKDLDLVRGVDFEDTAKFTDSEIITRAKEQGIDVSDYAQKKSIAKLEKKNKSDFEIHKKELIKTVNKMSNDGELVRAAQDLGIDTRAYEVPLEAQTDLFEGGVEQVARDFTLTKPAGDVGQLQPSPTRQSGDLLEPNAPQVRTNLENVQPVAPGDVPLKPIGMTTKGEQSRLAGQHTPEQQAMFAQQEMLLQGASPLVEKAALKVAIIKEIAKKKVPKSITPEVNPLTQEADFLLKGGTPLEKAQLRHKVSEGIRDQRRASTQHTKAVQKKMDKYAAWKRAPGKGDGNILRRGFNKAILGMRERLGTITKRHAHRLNKMERDASMTRGTAMADVTPFAKMVNSLNSRELAKFKSIAVTEGLSGMKKYLAGRDGSDEVIKGLDKMFQDMGVLGKETGEFAYDPEFYPRLIKDFEGLKKALGATERQRLDAKLKSIRLDGRSKQEVESELINKALFSSHLKDRTLTAEIIKSKGLEKYYADPVESIEHYINGMSETLHRRKFFNNNAGLNTVDGRASSMKELFKEDLDKGMMTHQDVEDASALLEARFGEGTIPTKGYIQQTKNFMYMTTLANPLSAATQLGDIPLGAHVNGISNTVYGLVKALSPKSKKMTLEETGIFDIGVDMASGLKSHKWLNTALKYSAFKKIDAIGKETLINASLRKNTKRVGSIEGRKRFIEEYKDAYTAPGQLEQVMRDMSKGNMTPDVKYVLWNDLTKMQPISMSEMPEMYLKNPNVGRFMYALKTFTVKQLNRMYFDGIREITRGSVKKGSAQLMGYAGLLTAGGMSTDAIKDTMLGREQQDFDDRFIANMYKVLGSSDYVMQKARRGDIQGAMAATILPPIFPMTMSLGKDMIPPLFDPEKEWKPMLEWNSMNNVPWGGRIAKSWWGGGAEAYNERQGL